MRPDAVPHLQAAGLHITGTDERNQRMEIVELPREGEGPNTHPFFFSCQYHPEFQSHPHRPSPPFHGFVLAASGQGDKIGVHTGVGWGGGGGGGGRSPPRLTSGGICGQSVGIGSEVQPPSSLPPPPPTIIPTPNSPTRPVRTQGMNGVPDVLTMRDIAPGEARGSLTAGAAKSTKGRGGSVGEE